MVGICGIAGNLDASSDRMAKHLTWLGDEVTGSYQSDAIQVHHSYHSKEAQKQPATAENGDILLWIWGDILGYERDDEYARKPPSESDASYCARLYDEHGPDFVDGLNSDFAGLIYDRRDESVTLFVDRLSVRPIYFIVSDSTLVFSTQLQSIPEYESVDRTFDVGSVSDFFRFFGRGGLGTKSVLKDVSKLHPGSKLRFDPRSSSLSEEIYWQPEYDPMDEPYEYFLEQFVDVITKAVRERVANVDTAGLYLSGGSDSRLVLELLGAETTAYHMNERMNTEATTAQQVADFVGSDFEFLQRTPTYYFDLLEEMGKISNYRGRLDQAHAVGFKDRIRDGVSAMFSGQYSDTVLGGAYIPNYKVPIPKINEAIDIPIKKEISESEYLSWWLDGQFWGEDSLPEYMSVNFDHDETFGNRLSTNGEGIEFSGVQYRSVEELADAGFYYPITNSATYLFYESSLQIEPVKLPFLDNRIVDLSLRIPSKYKLRHNLPNDALDCLNPDLAEIQHPQTKQPLTRSEPIQLASRYYHGLVGILTGGEKHAGSWPDHSENIREHDLIRPIIQENESLIEECEFLDIEEVYDCHSKHMSGEDRLSELYSLVTFLKIPMTEDAIRNENDA